MSSNEKSARCERLKVLTFDLAARHPGLLEEAPLLMQLLAEVNLYQTELEAQNEELRRTRQELEASRQQYSDLYKQAPTAYLTFNRQGLIKKANWAAASILRKNENDLIDCPFAAYLDSAYVGAFLLHLEKAASADQKVPCELVLRRKDFSRIPVLVESVAGKDESGGTIIHSMMSDVGELWELKGRLEFEELLSNLSTRFIGLPIDQIDSEIERALRDVLKLFQGDRCGLLEVDEEKRTVRVSHAAHENGFEPPAGDINLAALFPWQYERLVTGGEIVCFSRIDQLPPEAEKDRKTFVEWGVRSCLTIPVKVGDRVTHLLAMNAMRAERVWDQGHMRLRLLAEVFANSLERKRKELQLKQLRQKLQNENVYLRGEAKIHFEHGEVIGRSQALKRVLLKAEQVAPTDSTVLILGETGTGKELIAQCIHRLSKRKDRMMVKVNCASLPAPLVESELFGREKGAYTGALSRQVGRFEVANGSTLFLDEISELTPELQAKLLMVLQDGTFERLGSPQTLRVNVRIIAATNRNLTEAVQKGSFREDLYYRLNVFPIYVPPLRERREDVPLLAMAFVNEFGDKMGKKIGAVSRKTLEELQQYDWPGNIRELRNVIEQAVIISTGEGLKVNIPRPSSVPGGKRGPERNLREVQYRHILEVLETTGWRIKGPGGAAEVLGVKPSTLYTKMESLNIPTRHARTGYRRRR